MVDVVDDMGRVGSVPFDVAAGVDTSTFSPMSSASSSSSSAYCERLSSAFDGFGGEGFDTASIFLLRRSACGSRAGVAGCSCTGFDIAGGNKGPMKGFFGFSLASDSVSEAFLFLCLMPLGVTG